MRRVAFHSLLFLAVGCLNPERRAMPPVAPESCLPEPELALCAKRWPQRSEALDESPPQDADWVSRVSPEAGARLRAYRSSEAAQDGGISVAGRACLRVIIEFTGSIDDLERLSFRPTTESRHPTEGYAIATGKVALECLDEIAQVPHVVLVSYPQQYELLSSPDPNP